MTFAAINQVTFSDADVVNVDAFHFEGNEMFVFHDHGFILGVVFAASHGDAFDILADSGRINHFEITEEQADEYLDDEYAILGNANKSYDVEGIDVIWRELPKLSIVKLLS